MNCNNKNNSCESATICPCLLYEEKMEESLKRIEKLKSFMGEDDRNINVFTKSIEDMVYIIEQCNKHSIPQPEIFPLADGNGVQAEWQYDWYLEVDSCDGGVSILFMKGEDYDNAIDCNLYSIEDAFKMIKTFITYVVDVNNK